MKRFWIGVVLLIGLLAGGIWLSTGLSDIHENLSWQLAQASAAAAQGDWERANGYLSQAGQNWQRYRPVTAAFTDHAPLEELERLFAQAEICRSLSLEADCAYVCSSLSQICKAIAESMELPWWNML